MIPADRAPSTKTGGERMSRCSTRDHPARIGDNLLGNSRHGARRMSFLTASATKDRAGQAEPLGRRTPRHERAGIVVDRAKVNVFGPAAGFTVRTLASAEPSSPVAGTGRCVRRTASSSESQSRPPPGLGYTPNRRTARHSPPRASEDVRGSALRSLRGQAGYGIIHSRQLCITGHRRPPEARRRRAAAPRWSGP